MVHTLFNTGTFVKEHTNSVLINMQDWGLRRWKECENNRRINSYNTSHAGRQDQILPRTSFLVLFYGIDMSTFPSKEKEEEKKELDVRKKRRKGKRDR
jgi:hypothetical protein